MAVQGSTGYGPSSRYSKVFFSGNEDEYELWETRFIPYLELKDLKDVIDATDATL